MPEVIRKPGILRGLTERLGIQAGVTAVRRVLAPFVVPVTQVDALLETSHLDRKMCNLSGSTFVVVWEVPEGKRWRIIGIFRPITTGNCAVRFLRGTVDYFPLEPLGTTGRLIPLGRDWILGAGSKIGAWPGGNAGDMTCEMHLMYVEEDAY